VDLEVCAAIVDKVGGERVRASTQIAGGITLVRGTGT